MGLLKQCSTLSGTSPERVIYYLAFSLSFIADPNTVLTVPINYWLCLFLTDFIAFKLPFKTIDEHFILGIVLFTKFKFMSTSFDSSSERSLYLGSSVTTAE